MGREFEVRGVDYRSPFLYREGLIFINQKDSFLIPDVEDDQGFRCLEVWGDVSISQFILTDNQSNFGIDPVLFPKTSYKIATESFLEQQSRTMYQIAYNGESIKWNNKEWNGNYVNLHQRA